MIDSHCHLADEAFAGDLEAVVRRAGEAGVEQALCILDASRPEELERAQFVAAAWPAVAFAIGVHPHRAGQYAGRPADAVAAVDAGAGSRPRTVAIGEIGLDYHYEFAPHDVQREVFAAQVEQARRTGRPVVIHSREADADTITVLAEEGRGEVRGVFHCFTQDREQARRALDLGFVVSFSGIVTFPRADALRDVARLVPEDRLLVETDSPYLAPVPHRGKRNEPARVAEVLAALASARGVSIPALAASIQRNFRELFGR